MPEPKGLLDFSVYLFSEATVGLVLAYATRLIFTAVQIAGTVVDFQMGFGIVNVIDPQIHQTLAEALVGLQRYEEAIEEFATTVELSPKEPFPRFALADAYLQAEQPEKARETLEALLELEPDYPGAKLLLESLEETKDP